MAFVFFNALYSLLRLIYDIGSKIEHSLTVTYNPVPALVHKIWLMETLKYNKKNKIKKKGQCGLENGWQEHYMVHFH